MPKLSIAWQSLPTGVRFEVLESRFLKQSQVVRAADWVQNIDAKSGVGLAQLVAWLDDGTGERDGEGLRRFVRISRRRHETDGRRWG